MARRLVQEQGRFVGQSLNREVSHDTAVYSRSWLEKDRGPRAIVDRELSILWSNVAADLLLSDRQGLAERGGRLHAMDPAGNDALEDLLKGAESGHSTACIERPNRDGWLVLRACHLEGPPSLVFGIGITEASEGSRVTYQHLDVVFGLTKAEHRVLLALLDGNDAETLAAQRGVSVETARSQIRSIYLKVGVGSRERLFARLQHFRA
jgi:DNA-binding CsgD family transcriptional regulator